MKSTFITHETQHCCPKDVVEQIITRRLLRRSLRLPKRRWTQGQAGP